MKNYQVCKESNVGDYCNSKQDLDILTSDAPQKPNWGVSGAPIYHHFF